MITATFSFPRGLKLLLAIAGILILSACSTTPSSAVSERKATAEAGYGRVFGRVIYVVDGKEKTWSTFGGTLTLYVESIPTRKLTSIDVEKDGSFFLPLRSGNYALAGYRITGVADENGTMRFRALFSVPQPGKAVYIGDLRFDSQKGHARFHLLDNYDAALKREQAKLAAGKLQPVKKLIQPELEIGNFKQFTYICAKPWGLSCDRNHIGVYPTQPKGTDDGFPDAGSLTPTLEWKSSTRPEVSYDVAVFDSLNIGPMGKQTLRGALVAYAEGLHEPKFTLPRPLRPGEKYQWSVRLRDGDTVSNWSTTSHFSFYLVAWSSSWGNFFGFSTPATQTSGP